MKIQQFTTFAVLVLALVACDSPADEPAPAEEPAVVEELPHVLPENHDQLVEEPVAEPTSQPTSQPTADPHAGHDMPADPHAGHDHAAHGSGDGAEPSTGSVMDMVLAEGEYDPATLVQQPGANVGDVSRCLVSGEAFPVTEDHPHITHEGAEIYFCCPSCIRQFQRDPASFLTEG